MATMDRLPPGLLATLVWVSLLVSSEGDAQARGGSAEQRQQTVDSIEVHAARITELDTWLRRLTGRFSVSRRGRPQGIVDCAGFGRGPGVDCVLVPRPGQNGVLGPTVTLYGMDSNSAGVSYLQVNGRSIAEGDLGFLSGDTVTFSKVSCPRFVDQQPRVSIMTCDKKLRIHAPPHGKYILFQYITEQLIVLPTPPSGRRPPGQIATELIKFTEEIQLQRMDTDEAPAYGP